jgi:alanyl-tRNA synthetase
MGLITFRDIGAVPHLHLVRLIHRTGDAPIDTSLIPSSHAVVVIGREHEGQAALEVSITPDLEGKVHAGEIIKSIVGHIGGRGGGRWCRAQGGGNDPAGLPRALQAARGALAAQLGGEL